MTRDTIWKRASEAIGSLKPIHWFIACDLAIFIAIGASFWSFSAIAVALGCGAVGAFLGFLFGVPRVRRLEPRNGDGNESRVDDSEQGVRINSNFQAISDWLTMGLTLVALTNLGPIASSLQDFGVQITAKGPFSELPGVAAITILAGPVCIGFLQAYFWASTDYLRSLRSQEIQHLKEKNETLGAKLSSEIKANQVNEALLARGPVPKKEDVEEPREESATHENGWSADIWNCEPLENEPAYHEYVWDSDGILSLRTRVEKREELGDYQVTATVSRIDHEPLAPGSQCVFLLHPTYSIDAPDVTQCFEVSQVVGADGTARLKFLAAESFVLGARVEVGGRQHKLRHRLILS